MIQEVEFTYEEFYYFNAFWGKTSTLFKQGKTYSVICRVSYMDVSKDLNTEWKMLGNQIAICVHDIEALQEELNVLHDTCIK